MLIFDGREIECGANVITWKDKDGFNGYDETVKIIETESRKTGKVKKRKLKELFKLSPNRPVFIIFL